MEEPPPKPKKKKKKKKKKSKKRKGKKGKKRVMMNDDYPFSDYSDFSNESEYEWVTDSNSEFSDYSDENELEDPENGHKKYKHGRSPFEII